MTAASIALNRFGLGARPADQVGADARRWLIDQFALYVVAPPPIAAAPRSPAVAADLAAYLVE